MLGSTPKTMNSGTRVSVIEGGAVPSWSKWDDDRQRTSPSVKRRLQRLFFGGDRRILADVIHIGIESERTLLKRKGQVKVRVRDSSGANIVITAEVEGLRVVS